MKKIVVLVIVAILLIFSTSAAWGLNSPEITKEQGDVSLRSVSGTGLILGIQYGFTDELAVTADIGEDSYTRVSLKCELNPELALEGGLQDTGSYKPFIGVNAAMEIGEDLQGIAQGDIFLDNNNLYINYELGLKLKIDPRIDLMGGMAGTIDENTTTTNLQIGVDYRF